MNPRDAKYLARALTLARQGLFSTTPNPRVGCVIVREDSIIAEGWHRAAGEAHAEICALRQCDNIRGAEVFVNLEPCAHQGRTPSCAETLATAKPARVIIALPDPNPLTAGKGANILRAAGVECVFAPPQSESCQQALSLNIGFVSRMTRRRPWTRLKIAATMDGKTALANGLSKWITGTAARTDVHALRAASCAIITGIGTAEIDDPLLTVRHVRTSRQPQRVLIDRDLRASPRLKLFIGGALTATTCAPPNFFAPEVEVLSLPDQNGRVDLAALLNVLAEREMNEVMVEAGRRLCGAFLANGLVDEIVLYQAPRVFGGDALAMFDSPSPSTPETAATFTLREMTPLGDDIKLVYESPTARRQIHDATFAAVL